MKLAVVVLMRNFCGIQSDLYALFSQVIYTMYSHSLAVGVEGRLLTFRKLLPKLLLLSIKPIMCHSKICTDKNSLVFVNIFVFSFEFGR